MNRWTDAALARLPAPEEGYILHRDPDPRKRVPGLAVQITAAGSRSWTLDYRCRKGRQHRWNIGALVAWPLAAAREKAKELRRAIDGGACPVEDARAELAAEQAAARMADLAERYIEDHASIHKRASSREDDERMLARWVVPELGKLKVADVTTADVERLHRMISRPSPRHRRKGKGAPTVANRVVALLSKMFSLAIKWGMRDDNPAKGITRNAEEKRERYLTPSEVERLMQVLAEHPDRQGAAAIRLMLLTGARSGEVLKARWDQFDLTGGVWVKPGSTTKQATTHRVPLSGPARLLLAELHTGAGGAVFPGRRDLRSFWDGIRVKAKLEGVRIHDLRHHYASVLASDGSSLAIVGALLGHSNPTTTKRYSHLFDEPLRRATERVGEIITAAEGKARPAAAAPLATRGQKRV